MVSLSTESTNGNNTLISASTMSAYTNIQIYRSDAERFSPEKCIHSCQMDITWTGNDQYGVLPLKYKMKMEGAKGQCNFLIIRSPSACTS